MYKEGMLGHDQPGPDGLFRSIRELPESSNCSEAKGPRDRTPLESTCRTLNNGFDGIVRYVVRFIVWPVRNRSVRARGKLPPRTSTTPKSAAGSKSWYIVQTSRYAFTESLLCERN